MEVGYNSDPGLLRELNEDSVLCSSFDLRTHLGTISAGLFIVADGMGGHSAGEIASDLATRTFYLQCISRLLSSLPNPPVSVLTAAFEKANSNVFESARNRNLQGMGTTLTAALVVGGDIYVAHVGDSRCYIINTRETIQVTKDHSVVQQFIDAGIITPEQAINHPRKNEITRVLGYSADTTPDTYHLKLFSGDNILLCSDGLSGVLTSNKISETVINALNPKQACLDLTAQANLSGGPDNIAVIVAKPPDLPYWQAAVTAETSISIRE